MQVYSRKLYSEQHNQIAVQSTEYFGCWRTKKKAVAVNFAIWSNGNIKKREHEKLEKNQGLRVKLERMRGVKASVVPVAIGALGANHRAGRVAPTNPRINIWDLCLGECYPWEQLRLWTGPSGSQASGRGLKFEGDPGPPTEGEWWILKYRVYIQCIYIYVYIWPLVLYIMS